MSLFGNWGQQGQQQQQQQQQPAAGAFGAPQQQPQPGAFGGGGGFGAAPAFGAQPQPGQSSAFGAQPAAGGGFGAAGGAFGAQNRPAFGAASGAFGAGGAAGSFGGGGFGAATPAPAAGGFGAAPAAGASGSSMFGGAPAATPAAGGFGAGSSLFGAAKPAAAGFGAGAMVPAVQNGTAAPPYEVTQERDTVGAQSVVLHFQSISCMPAYKTQSFEELRVQDYAQGRKTATGFGQTGAFGGQAQQQPQPQVGLFGAAAPAPGGFGQPATANPTPSFGAAGNAFGAQQNPASAFGGGGFGAQPQAQQQPAAGFGAAGNAFGAAQPAQQPSLFGGNAAQSNAFGQPAGQTTGFGAAAGAFGAKPAGFGTGAFGAAPAAPAAPATNFGFPAQPQQQPQQPGSLFGGQPQQQQQTGFGFNTQQPKPLFGAQQPAAAPAFGQQPQDANKPAGSLFGGGAFGAQQPAQQTPTFGAQPTQQQTPGLFGQQQSAAPSLFGQQQQPQQQQQQAGGFGGGIFGNKPATPTAPSLFGGGAFGQQQPAQQQGVAGINPLTGQPTQSLFGNQQAQPAVTGFGGTSSLFGNKPPATGLFGQQQPATQGAPSLFSSTAGGATGSIFGQSVLGQQQQQQQQQPALVAEIDKPINHGLPVFSLLAPGPRAIPATSTLGNSTATKKQSYFADMPTKAPVPRLGQSSYTPPTAKLRGFAASGSAGSLSGSISNLNISSAPSRNLSSSPFGVSGSSGALTRHPTLSASLSTMAPEAFATSSSSTSLGGKRQSVKKLVLDKRPSSPTLGSTGDSRPASPSRVSFNPSAGARERERERERTAVPAPATAPRPPSPAPEVRRAPTPAAASKLGGSGTSGNHTGQSNLQDGYWIRPSLDALARATGPIHGLTIGRTGYGSVQFIAPVDLKQCPPPADIPGNIVVLDNKSCTVYPDEDSKAAEGTGLNVPARIALEGCWAIDKANRQPIKQESHPKHVAHVRKLKEMSDTGFISFDVTTGTWTFTVEHFSRYGLGEDDDSEDEEERMEDEDEDAEPYSSPLKGREKPRAPVEKGTPALESPFIASTGAGTARAVSYAVRKGIEQDKVHTMQASLFRVPEARAAAGATKSAKSSPFGPPAPSSSRMDTSESGTSTAAPRGSTPSAVKSSLSNVR